MNRAQFGDALFAVELHDQLLREDLGSLTQAIARAQALELVNKTSRVRNRKRLHFARVAENVPEQGQRQVAVLVDRAVGGHMWGSIRNESRRALTPNRLIGECSD